MNERICALDDCTRTLLALGLCRKHYERYRRCGDPLWHEPERRVGRPAGPPKEPCRMDDCEDPERSFGLCQMHYARWRRWEDPFWAGDRQRDPLATETCAVEDCDGPTHSVGLCSKHYQQWVFHGTALGNMPEREPKLRPGKPPKPCATCEKEIPAGRKFCSTECAALGRGMCRGPECTNSAVQANLCAGHLHQRAARGYDAELSPMKIMRSAEEVLERDEHGHKLCITCNSWRRETEFGEQKTKTSPDGLNTSCRKCRRRKSMLLKFGITPEQYDEMFERQNSLCAMCMEPPEGERPLYVDHDHRCCPDRDYTCGECIRGLLCYRCNLGLGQLRDRVDILERGIVYMKYFEALQAV